LEEQLRLPTSEAAISTDRPKAFNHVIERAFRHELDWLYNASANAESCLPTFGLVDSINRRKAEDGWSVPFNFPLEAYLVSHDVFGTGAVLHVKILPYVGAIEATPNLQLPSGRATSNS
jgi:hypothetical protein